MAARPKSICRHAACRTAIAMPGYCEKHAKEAVGWNKSSTKSRHERGYGSAWDAIRLRVLARDCGLCQPCYRAGRIHAAQEVDHIVSKAAGGTDDESNLQAIATACHRAKTIEERRGPGAKNSTEKAVGTVA
jgi:5-methylcytosine-specific restriction protein A